MEGKKRNFVWLRIVVILAITISPIYLYKMGMFHLFMDKERLLALMESLGAWAFLGFILLQAGQVVVAPIPGEVTGLIGGFMFGPVLGVILSTTGLTIGSLGAYMLSRFFGRPVVEKFVSRRVIDKFDYLIEQRGLFITFLLFLIPGLPKDSFCYILGLGTMAPFEFIAVSATGRLLGTILLTMGGYFLRHKMYVNFGVLLVVSGVIGVITVVYRQRIEAALKSWHIARSRRHAPRDDHPSGRRDRGRD